MTKQNRPPQRRAYKHARLDTTSTKLTGVVTYLHATKGWRFRRPTPQLLLALTAEASLRGVA